MPMPMFNPQGKTLGILKPVGGGDPIPLKKAEVIIGRRRSCDINLDFNWNGIEGNKAYERPEDEVTVAPRDDLVIRDAS